MAKLLRGSYFGLRILARRPGLALILLSTLGLGVGANTAIFSVLNAVVLRPFPYPGSERLVMLWEVNGLKSSDREPLSPVNLNDYMGLRQVFTGVAGWWRPQLNLSDEGKDPVRVEIVDVTDNFFSVLGVKPALGRAFLPGESPYGADPVAIISHELWTQRYGGNAILGRSITLDGRNFEVVGIAPPGFSFPGNTSIWRPLGWDLALHSRAAHFMEAVARLEPGVTVERAQAELSALARRLELEHPPTNEGWGARVVSLQEELLGGFRIGAWLALGAIVTLLLIACINFANILLSQATFLEREAAIRLALGADRLGLQLRFAVEGLVLALLGAGLGLAFAAAGIKWLTLAAPFEVPRLDQVRIDGRVLVFTFVVTLLTGILLGLAPALRILRVNTSEALKEGSSHHSVGTRGGQLRRALVICEITLATMMAASAGLLVRSFLHILNENLGVRTRNVLTASVQLPVDKYDSWNEVQQFYSLLLEGIRANETVSSVDVTSYLPLDPAWRMPFIIPNRPKIRAAQDMTAQFRIVSPDYFRTMGIPILEGRSFSRADTAQTPGVVIVSREAVKQFWAGNSPVGGRISAPKDEFGPLGQSLITSHDYEVIGVAADTKNNSLLRAAEPAMYFTYRQFPYRNMCLVVRGKGDLAVLAGVVRSELHRLDPTIALADVRSIEQILATSLANRRFAVILMSTFAGLALSMAALGIYGILSYWVTHRRQEIGIRLALGAQSRDIVRLIVGEGLVLAGVGIVVGTGGALFLARFIAHFLYGIEFTDWVTFSGTLAIVLSGVLLASWRPARRAACLDPLSSLKHE